MRSRFSRSSQRSRHGVTLIELLVVVAIIGLLTALMLPAVQAAREASRRMTCKNHLKQVTLAVHQFESTHKEYPASFPVGRGVIVRGSWSIHARVLPYIERYNEFVRIDFGQDWHYQVETGMPAQRIPVYLCPSDPNTQVRYQEGQSYVHPITYGFNLGTWWIFDPQTYQGGDGAFRVGRPTLARDLHDGLSQTLCVAEVKAYTSYVRNTAQDPGPMIPDAPEELSQLTGEMKLGPAWEQNTGHTVWSDGRVHHTGFTTTFTPNRRVPYWFQDRWYDIDLNTQQEGRDLTRPSYAAVTSRSHHSGLVHVSLMDGSVREITDDVDVEIWRSLGKRDTRLDLSGSFSGP